MEFLIGLLSRLEPLPPSLEDRCRSVLLKRADELLAQAKAGRLSFDLSRGMVALTSALSDRGAAPEVRTRLERYKEWSEGLTGMEALEALQRDPRYLYPVLSKVSSVFATAKKGLARGMEEKPNDGR